MRSLLPAVFLFLVVGSLARASSRGERERGAQVFATSGCPHCHSIHHVGGHKGPDLSGIGRTLTKAQIRRQIVYGGNEMPPFADVLEPDDVKDLVTYLRSCREKTNK